MKTTCFFCGAEIPIDAEVCPNCRTATNPFEPPEIRARPTTRPFVGPGRRGEPISYSSLESFWRCLSWRWLREKSIGGRRASRSEFWCYFFWSTIVYFLCREGAQLVEVRFSSVFGTSAAIEYFVRAVWGYFTVVGATTWIRRAQDSGNSGWLLLFFGCFLLYPIAAVPLTPGDLEANRYGPNPRFDWIPNDGREFATTDEPEPPVE